MPLHDDPAYLGREQSLIKHEILEKYLERFAHIVGSWANAITYIDGFSGPWNLQSTDLHDSSFAIALQKLRQARETVRDRFKRDFAIRCLFLEKEPGPYRQLDEFARAQADVDTKTIHGSFEDSIAEILAFIRSGPREKNFPFIFIDPTGWTGFALNRIKPLLQLNPCEVLVNFMTGHIMRFVEIEDGAIDPTFEALFGDAAYRRRLDGLTGRRREDALVFEYAHRIKTAGNFPYVPVTVVPHPETDRTHFHLVYATRSARGLEVFKTSEAKALELTMTVRADAKRRKRERISGGQGEFFTGIEAPDHGHAEDLHRHYSATARVRVHDLMRTKLEVPYDDVCAVGLQYPTISEADVRQWILEIAEFQRLEPGKRVPKLGKGCIVRLKHVLPI